MNWRIAMIGCLVFSLAACAAPATAPAAPAAPAGYTDVTPAQLADMLKHKDFLFVNVHVPYEGEIADTDTFIPFADGEQRVADYPADKAAKIVLYCRSGRMSTIVAQALVKAGYTNVWNLAGGMVAWEQAGLEILHK